MYEYDCRDSSDILRDIDPDTNGFIPSNTSNCKYFFPSDLESTHTNWFSILHVNIRSIRKNFKKLYELITTIKQPFDVLALSETWVSDIDAIEDYNIDGYTAIYQNRQDREGGGVCIFINSLSYDFQFVECMSYKDTFNNILTIKLTPKFQHDINKSKRRDRQKLFTVCYRSPDTDNNSFINNLTPILTKIHRTNKPSYIIGDMNYNIVNTNHHQPTQTYYTLLTALMYQQVINKPTRITETSSTIIDHIWHNDVTNGYDSQHNRSGILYCNISDHLPIFFQITSNKTRNIKVKTLDDIMLDKEVIEPVLIKIDVQGYELEVLKGSDKLLNKIDYIVLEVSKNEMYKNQPKVDQIALAGHSLDNRRHRPARQSPTAPYNR